MDQSLSVADVTGVRVLALEPHARRLQFQLSSGQVPAEILTDISHCVHITRAAVALAGSPPESAAVVDGAVVMVPTVGPRVIVAVVRCKQHPVMSAERVITGVTCRPQQLLGLYNEG